MLGQCAGDVGVVEAGVTALRLTGVQQRAGLHVEFLDFDVGRQRVAFERPYVFQAGEVIAVDARHERVEEALLQATAAARRIQRQCRVNMQPARRIALDAPIQRVEQAMRLADPQRRTDVQGPVDTRQDAVDGQLQ